MVDMLATLTLVTVLGTIATPMVNRYVSAARLRGAKWSLARDLQRTRQRAITENRRQRLTLSTSEIDAETGASEAYLMAPSATGWPAERRDVPRGVECVTAPGSFVEFDSRGLASGTLEFQLRVDGPTASAVRVRSTGHVDFPG